MTIRFYFPRYKSKNPEQTIFCRVYENKKELNLNTGCKCDSKYWDKNRQRVNLRKVKNPLQKNVLGNLNKILDAYETKVSDIVYQVRSKNPVASFDHIVDEIKNYDAIIF